MSDARPRFARAARAASFALAIICPASSARADPASEAQKRADALFAEGKGLMKEGRVAEACPVFAASVAADPGLGAMLWEADCDERSGHLSMAWREFGAAEARARSRNDARASIAGARREALEAQLARVSIATSDLDEHLSIDGADADLAAWHDGAVLAPGPHVFVVRRADGATWSASVELRPKDARVLRPLFVPDGPNGPLAVADPSTDRAAHEHAESHAAPDAPPAPPSSGSAFVRTFGVGALAAGVVAIGSGLFLGVEAKAAYGGTRDEGHCDANNRCDSEGMADRAHAGVLARDATVVVVIGSAAAVGGFLLALRPWGHDLRVTPTTGRNQAGFVAAGAF